MKKGLMQVDPMTGMPVTQTASSPMYPVSPTSAIGGSSARFNPMINQYATEDPLANASLAAQPMPTFANGMYQRTNPPVADNTRVNLPTGFKSNKELEGERDIQETINLAKNSWSNYAGYRSEDARDQKQISRNIKISMQNNGMNKAIPEDATGLQNLAKSGPKGKAAVENMGYETNALARMKGNGMYKKNCGYKK